MVLRYIIMECVSTWLVSYVCEVGKSELIMYYLCNVNEGVHHSLHHSNSYSK